MADWLYEAGIGEARADADGRAPVGREGLDLAAADGPREQRVVADLEGAVAAYVTPAHQHPLGPVMAGSLLTTIPCIGAYVFFQRYIVVGLTMGADR